MVCITCGCSVRSVQRHAVERTDLMMQDLPMSHPAFHQAANYFEAKMQDTMNATEGYQLCCCCLELVSLKGLWRQYMWMGRTEVYGDMLEDCFNLSWEQKDETKDLICEVCITRLRNAVQFKQKVIQCQSVLRLRLLDGIQSLKEEILDLEVPKKGEFDADILMKLENEGDSDNQPDHVFDDNDYEITNYDIAPIKKEKGKIKNGAFKNNSRKSTRKCQDEDIKKNSNYVNPRLNVALILEHSTIVPFKSRVGVCGMKFATNSGLSNHLVVHSGEKNYECEVCHKKYGRKKTLAEHLRIHRNDRSQCYKKVTVLRNRYNEEFKSFCEENKIPIASLFAHKRSNERHEFPGLRSTTIRVKSEIDPFYEEDSESREELDKKTKIVWRQLVEEPPEHLTIFRQYTKPGTSREQSGFVPYYVAPTTSVCAQLSRVIPVSFVVAPVRALDR
ncbi:hypothetical protein PYW08_012724 [Mythimna loreyi]|uniref:Uncharacterized protein n=1 Tax=Mythimna loreyi TaxID=667449 RepID=A0ACC2Q0Y1_9NEOP|nr:hypothetical protein PYW08_012724 [Mythimna loreyi]